MNTTNLYLVILEVLAVSLIMIVFTYYRDRRKFKDPGRYNWKATLLTIVMLSIIGLVCTTYISVKVDGQLVTPRDFIILFSALVYGPVVGTPVALVLGSGRFVVGGIAAVSCAISCVTALALGSVLWYLNRGKAPDMTASTAMMFFAKCISLSLIMLYNPGGNPLTLELITLTVFASVASMIIAMYHYRKFVVKKKV